MAPKLRTWGVVLVFGAAALAAYWNSFRVPFVFDDEPSILENVSIRQLWPLAAALHPPTGFGITVSGRPLLNVTLAANYAAGGANPLGYHLVNLAIHLLAGLTLFGIVRRTVLRITRCPVPDGWTDAFAAGFALLWMLHPLQTESVTYTIQRAESLAGLFFLCALYTFIRAAAAATSRARFFWQVGSVAAGVAGAGCKEIIVVAPIVIALYDRAFIAGRFGEVWQRRKFYYLALFATWIPLGVLVASTGGTRGGTFDFTAVAFVRQWIEEGPAVLRYVRLTLWPAPLIFEYGAPTLTITGVKLAADLAVAVALVIAWWAAWRRPRAGFFAISFFLILAPSSLLPGTIQVIVEHRMYLPLGALLALLAGAGLRGSPRITTVALFIAAAAAGFATARRNRDYASDLTLWSDTVQKRPSSARAQGNLGTAYFRRGCWYEARAHNEIALQLDPASAQAHYNYGLVAAELGDHDRARTEYAAAIERLPYLFAAHTQLAREWLRSGNIAAAIPHLEAAAEYQPNSAQAAFDLGQALATSANTSGARYYFLRVLQLDARNAAAHYQLGLLDAAENRAAEAESEYRQAIRLEPRLVEARLNLGIALAQRGEKMDALTQLREVARQNPELAEGWTNLGIVQADLGQASEAVQSYRAALQRRPVYPAAEYNLGNALVQLGRLAEAREHFAAAVREQPEFAAAQEMIARIDAGRR